MARCITYFTMLVELLIIKNVKAACVVVSTVYTCRFIWHMLYVLLHRMC